MARPNFSGMSAVTGNTYPVKDRLREMGGRWNAEDKAWMLPADKLAEAQALVAAVPAKAPSMGRRRTAPSRFGARGYGDGGPRGKQRCYMCGSYYCDGARGGLCEND